MRPASPFIGIHESRVDHIFFIYACAEQKSRGIEQLPESLFRR